MKKLKILLLEDNRMDADLVLRQLARDLPGCQVDVFTTLQEAREKIGTGKMADYDAALLDMKLPDGLGFELLEEIVRRQLDFPVIMLTGSGDEETAITALKSGASDYVVKYNDYLERLPGILLQAIREFDQKRKEQSELIDVLYVEHHLADIDLTMRYFTRHAPMIHLEVAKSVMEALSLLQNQASPFRQYKVIILDFRLPQMNAFEFIKKVRQEYLLDIPIIVVTGQGNEDIAVQALKIGANDYLPKSGNYIMRLPSMIINLYHQDELAHQQKALAESEKKYRLLAENVSDVIFVLDWDQRFLFVSPSVQVLRGCSAEETMQERVEDVLTPESRKKAIEYFKAVRGRRKSYDPQKKHETTLELQVMRHDGTPVWTETRVSILFDEKNRPIGVLGVIRDFTRRKQVLEQLRKLSRAIEQSPASIVITDLEGRIEYVNPKFTEMTGYTFEEIKGKNPRILKSCFTTREEYEELWETILAGNEWKGEFQNRRKDGSLYWEQANISPIRDGQGKITHFLAVKEDISEKKKNIEALIEARRKAEESDRLKTAFLANMSHEIRTPMNGILGFIELLKEADLTSHEKNAFIDQIKNGGQRLIDTMNEIIEMSKMEAGLIPVKIGRIDLTELMEDLYCFFKPQMEEKDLQFDLTTPLGDEDRIVFFSDKGKLESILSNLLKNAQKFTPQGSVLLSAQVDKDKIVFGIHDTGKGIPLEKLEAIFERFEQADTSLSRDYEGAGLGLSISKAYASMLGGRITVESVEGRGSSFFLTIPFRKAESLIAKAADLTGKQSSVLPPGLKILVAEDDRISAHLLASILNQKQATVILAADGLQAVEACEKTPDLSLVLMDLKMPVMDGLEAARKIRAKNKYIPIIAQTAYTTPYDRERALEAGCSDYLTKPIDMDLLIEKIIKHYEERII